MWATSFRHQLLLAYVVPVRQGLKAHGCNATIHLQRAIILAGGIAAALAIFFILSLYVFPQSFQDDAMPSMPEALVSQVTLSSQKIALGEPVSISVTGTNAGDTADMQIVSIGFPNLANGSDIEVVRHDFRQSPLVIERGDPVGGNYSGTTSVTAQYPSIEAFSRPWEQGSTYTIDLQVTPQAEGNFAVHVKSVAFPHTWDGAHYPREGLVDYQQEFVDSYSIEVTKS